MIDTRKQKIRRSPEELVKHLQSFNLDLKFSAGIWFFSPGGGRFHAAYAEPISMEQRLEKAAKLKDMGLAAIEAHYPSEINEDNLDMWKKFLKDTGMKVSGLAPNIFYDAIFEFGALSSPVPEARNEAIRRLKVTLQFAKELGTDFVIIWPGIDGYENPFGIDMMAMRDRFASAIAEAMDAVPGMPIVLEPKPYEPRGRIIYGTTPEAIMLCQKVEGLVKNDWAKKELESGNSVMALNPEIGHVLMGFEDVAYAFSLAMEYGKLGHTHWNSQPLGNYDQDLNLGVVSPEQAEAGLYVLKMYGYEGYFGIDINPERMPVERAMINNMDALKAMNERINSLDHAKIIEATMNPKENRGVLEAILIRARYPMAKDLSPLP